MKWVSVQKRLPQKEGIYLVHIPTADNDKPLTAVAWYSTGNHRWEVIPVVFAHSVTHWMPLPKPPEHYK